MNNTHSPWARGTHQNASFDSRAMAATVPPGSPSAMVYVVQDPDEPSGPVADFLEQFQLSIPDTRTATHNIFFRLNIGYPPFIFDNRSAIL